MAFKVLFKASVKKDLRNIDKKEIKKIIVAVVGKLAENPKAGKRLTGDFSGLFSYRTGVHSRGNSLHSEVLLQFSF